jgi:hypothetical protein
VFASYGIPYSTHTRYELDHLIPLELGGNNTARNLWPEPLTDDDKIGPSKDALENHLHALVCSGQLDLGAAQRGIATNWLGMWNDYEHVAIHHKSSSSGSSGSGSTGSGRSSGGSSGSGGSSSGGSSDHGGATAQCNDGTLSYAAHHQGACSHHGGVAVWYR